MVKDIGKGKTHVGASASASAAPKVTKATTEIPRDENPSLYYICLWTQQALECHIKLDGKVKLEMMAEINLLHNYTRQAFLHEKELHKRTWTFLRKHYDLKQLSAKGIENEYDYLKFFEVPCIQMQTPVLPRHSDSTDLLFVEPDDEIEDTVGALIFKPDAPRSTPEAAPEARAMSPAPASASTIPCSVSSNS